MLSNLPQSTVVAIVFSVVFGMLPCMYDEANTQTDKDKKLERITAEIDSSFPSWAGRFSIVNIDAVVDYVIAPGTGIAVVYKHNNVETIQKIGEVTEDEGGTRIKVRWDNDIEEPTAFSVISHANYIALVPTGDIHRFFIDVRKSAEGVKRYPHRKVLDQQEVPKTPSDFNKLRDKAALYCEVEQIVEIQTTELSKARTNISQRRQDKEFKVEQTLKIAAGSESGIYVGLLLLPIQIGSMQTVTVTEVHEKFCLATVESIVSSKRHIISVGDLLTSGRQVDIRK